MIGFIEVHKQDYKNRVLIAVDDISSVYEIRSGNSASIYLKSDGQKCGIDTEESYKEVCELIKYSYANGK